jgi:anthranilate/para-aminobenzoate synthase component I
MPDRPDSSPIRTTVCKDGFAHFNVGADVVTDSNPAAEDEETPAKTAGFLAALNQPRMDTDGPNAACAAATDLNRR